MSGPYRERVAFEQRSNVVEEEGGVLAGDWEPTFTVAARIRPRLGGSETVMAARLGGRQPYTITVRYSSQTKQVTTDWRARDVRSGLIHNIRSVVNPDEHKHELDFVTETGVQT